MERFKRGQQIRAHRKSKSGLGYPIIIRPFCSSVRPFSRRRSFDGSARGISKPKKGDRGKRLDWKQWKQIEDCRCTSRTRFTKAWYPVKELETQDSCQKFVVVIVTSNMIWEIYFVISFICFSLKDSIALPLW